MEPVVFGDGAPLSGVLTRPREAREPGVVICAPLGHPNVCSYRPLRTLAERVAEHGFPVLRFDWAGTGDSADIDSVADHAAEWMSAICQAVATVRERTGVEDVSLVGLRVGALLAMAAAASDADVSSVALSHPSSPAGRTSASCEPSSRSPTSSTGNRRRSRRRCRWSDGGQGLSRL